MFSVAQGSLRGSPPAELPLSLSPEGLWARSPAVPGVPEPARGGSAGPAALGSMAVTPPGSLPAAAFLFLWQVSAAAWLFVTLALGSPGAPKVGIGGAGRVSVGSGSGGTRCGILCVPWSCAVAEVQRRWPPACLASLPGPAHVQKVRGCFPSSSHLPQE